MILDTIAESTKQRIENKKNIYPLFKLKADATNLSVSKDFPFEKALSSNELSFICEVKKASPSKGVIAEDFPYLQIAKEYEEAGASAISVLTEPKYFLGKDEYITEISQAVSIPILRKDFVVDSYQIYETKLLGASAVLLICSLLNTNMLKKYIKIADELGLSCLVEAHNEQEINSALDAGARIIGVNNRNLQTFEVDLNNSVNLRKLVPPDVIFVSESGIKTPDDTKKLYENNTNAVLIGESFMRSENKKTHLKSLQGWINVEN